MINLLLLRKRKHFFLLKLNVNTRRVLLLRTLMLKLKITLLSKIMLMLNLCLLILPFHLLLPPLSIHPLKILSLSNLLPILHPTKILIFFHVVPYSYPQGLPVKQTEANLHLARNTFDNAKPKEDKLSSTIMPTLSSP